MKKTIILGKCSKKDTVQELENIRTLYFANSIEDVQQYSLETSYIDSFIFFTEGLSKTEIRTIIKQINCFPSIITVILLITKDFDSSHLVRKEKTILIMNYDNILPIIGNIGNSENIDEKSTKDSISFHFSFQCFINAEQQNFLINQILPYIKGKEIKIWITGQTNALYIYSVLFSLIEYQFNVGHRFNYKLFLSDISTEELNKIETGVFKKYEFNIKNIATLKHFFLKSRQSDNNIIKVKNEFIRKALTHCVNYINSKTNLSEMDVILLNQNNDYFIKSGKEIHFHRYYKYIKMGSYLFFKHKTPIPEIPKEFTPVSETIFCKKK